MELWYGEMLEIWNDGIIDFHDFSRFSMIFRDSVYLRLA
mgnify:CR=1 FL=1